MDEKTFYVTTPIYYVSGKPHLGHAYTSIACDVIARWNRNIGKDVFFLSGTDEHGQKVKKKADEKGMTPKDFVDSLIPDFQNILKVMNISNDYFIRTTNEDHKKFVQDMLQKSYDNGDIYKGFYEGLYCIDCEQYYKEDELIDEKICPIHKKEVQLLKDENYFFRLSKYQDKLLELYEKTDFLSPKSKSQETINRVKEGLQDISISRSKKMLDWGIEFPFDKDHVAYVWFDALFNYVSALKINDKNEFWPANYHVVGKDIMWFHKVYWPAFLMSVGMEVPQKVFAHGWWTVNGEKMGKSMGNVIEPVEVANKYGTDEFRYFLLSVGTFGEDLDFSYEHFAEKINNDLNNDFGNLVSRVHSMTSKYFPEGMPKVSDLTSDDTNLLETLNFYEKFNTEMQNLQYNRAIETLWNAIRETNAYINKVSPWKEEDQQRLGTIMNILCSSCILFAKYVDCFMPTKSEKVFAQFNIENDKIFKLEFFEEGHKLNEKENLFQKIIIEEKTDKNIVDEKMEENKREGFEKLNLKVGEIIEISQHPNAEKLYIEKIDLGEEEPRQIISGLKDYYEMDELKGRKVIVVANLKPAKLRGEMSQGMILAAEDEEGNVGLVTTDAQVGTNITCGDMKADNDEQIKIDDFFEIKMNANGKNALFEENILKADNRELTIHREIVGNIR